MSARSTVAMMTLISTTSATTGCYSTWDLAPKAVIRLDGYHDDQAVALTTADNKEIIYRHDSSLQFEALDGTELKAQFKSIRIQEGTLVGIEREKGSTILVDLSRMKNVQARAYSPSKTAIVATTSIVVGLPVLAITGFLVVLVAKGGFGGGRPLRIAGRTEPMRAGLHRNLYAQRQARASRLSHMNNATQVRVFEHWAKEASAECASVPAFLALARDLQKASAPERLVRAALHAAQQEANHTDFCLGLANMHADAPILASAPPTPAATDENLDALLQRLALEAFWDGCVAEGAAANVAQRSTPDAQDPRTRLALQTIARDELKHARLSQDIVAYCLSAGGRTVRQALGESLEHKRAAEEAKLSAQVLVAEESDAVDLDLLAHCGVPNEQLLQAAQIETWERNVGMLRTLQQA